MNEREKRRQLHTEAPADGDDATRVATQVRGQLEQRGVRLHDADGAEDEAVMLEAVEAFEAAVRRRGGDSYTNTPMSSRPDRPEFVLPERGDDERADTYARRVRARAAAVDAGAGDPDRDADAG